jgi:hypothetical protein
MKHQIFSPKCPEMPISFNQLHFDISRIDEVQWRLLCLLHRDRAIHLVLSLVPEPSVEQRQAALLAAATYALSQGVTTVGDMGRLSLGDTIQAWRDLEEVCDDSISISCDSRSGVEYSRITLHSPK